MLNAVLEKSVEPVKWLIIIGIAYTLAMTVWRFFETPVVSPIVSNAQVQTDRSSRPPPNINGIVAKNLFGEEGASAPVAQRQTTSTKTRLPLELQSVFVADEAERSTAIVAQKGKPGRMYRVGENLPGNAELVEVSHDEIFIQRAGVRESLPFPKSASSTSFQAQLVEQESSGIEDQGYEDTDYEDAEYDEPDYDDPEFAGDNEELTAADYQEQFAEDAEGTLEELGIETASGGGYKIGSSVADKYLQQTGLQTGDVILSVNGQPVGDIQQDKMELTNILAQGTARIEVQRGSRRFFVTARLPN